MTTTTTKQEVLEQLLSDICFTAHKHEVQYWLDAPGTDAEKLWEVQCMARNALALLRDEIKPEDA